MAAVDIPSRHKAIIYDEPGKISTKIIEIDTPKPGVGEVLIKLSHSGVCHSDTGIMENSWAWLPAPTQAGQVGGHEVSRKLFTSHVEAWLQMQCEGS